ncbi:MAG: tagaturonate epimerase family protein [Chthoniobacteraceae bacterium]
MHKIEKYTFGMGDRFAHEGHAQLQAVLTAREAGLDVYPVWNKSNREHTIVKSKPDDLRAEADDAVAALGWKESYYVDADHIGLKTVDGFIAASNFYTLDVADFTGKPADVNTIADFVKKMAKYTGSLSIPGIAQPFALDENAVRAAATKFLLAAQEAGRIYRHIEEKKGRDNFVTEVSVDETDTPQTPVELFLILAMLAGEGVPAQTVAPKFTGRFNKGVDYVGNIAQFEKEFDEDLAVIAFAIREFSLPETLKLSVHSGSDKFSLYPIINRLIKKHNAGLHVKTAGTTWLEEVIGLAEAGGEGLGIAKEIYAGAYPKAVDLIAPYAPVVDIEIAKLPSPEEVAGWSSEKFVSVLRHDQSCPAYDAQFRQFIHVAFKVAAQLGDRYTDALKKHRAIIARNVTHNLLERHILPIFR